MKNDEYSSRNLLYSMGCLLALGNKEVNRMTNADKFKSLFGIYATELWAMSEKDFLEWLNSEVSNCSEIPNNSSAVMAI